MKILIADRKTGSLSTQDETGMYRLRYRVFCERLGWNVPSHDAREFDGYDGPDATYVIVKDGQDVVRGCWRVLPTTGPYMLRDTFPELLGDAPAPCARHVWELSRFAFDKGTSAGATMSPLVTSAMAELVAHALEHRVDRFVTVTTAAIERLLERIGIPVRRLTPPRRIGVEGRTVALSIDVSPSLLQTLRRACGSTPAACDVREVIAA